MKKYVIGMLAVILAIAGTAFTAHKSKHPVQKSPNSLFYYKYNLTTASGENTPSNYTFISPQPANDGVVEDCGGQQIPCVIHATGSMTAPDASQVSSSNLSSVTLTQKDEQ